MKRARHLRLNREQQALVERHVHFAVSMASQYHKEGHREELISEAYVGLCIAASKFEPERHLQFTTFSGYWIRAMILDYLLRNHSQVRTYTSGEDQKLFFGLRRAYSALGEEATPEAVAAFLEIKDVDRVRYVHARFYNQDTPLDAALAPDKSMSMADCQNSPEERVAEAEEQTVIRRRVRTVVDNLEPRARLILKRRYLEKRSKTLKELGVELGISRERVRQIEEGVLAKLKKRFA